MQSQSYKLLFLCFGLHVSLVSCGPFVVNKTQSNDDILSPNFSETPPPLNDLDSSHSGDYDPLYDIDRDQEDVLPGLLTAAGDPTGGELVDEEGYGGVLCTVPKQVSAQLLCRTEVVFTKAPNFVFYGTFLASLLAYSDEECAKACLTNPFCESANFHSDIALCELNSNTRAAMPAEEYEAHTNVNYLSSIVCKPEPKSMACGVSIKAARFTHLSLYYARVLDMPIAQASEVRPHSHPWMVSVRFNGQHVCSAVLIHELYVLTSASCFASSTRQQDYEAVIGEHVLGATDTKKKVLSVESIIIHESYSPNDNRLHDLAILKLKAPVTIDSVVRPICPPAVDVNVAQPTAVHAEHRLRLSYTECITVGWNKIGGYAYMNRLSALYVRYISRDKCNSRSFYSNEVRSSMLCVDNPSVGSCMPDVGGPLLCTRDGSWDIVGLFSWGEGCVRANKPAVFTNVYLYLDWIRTSTAAGRTNN